MKSIKKASKAKNSLVISMTYGFFNVATEEKVYIISFPKLGNVFYLKAEYCNALMKLVLKK